MATARAETTRAATMTGMAAAAAAGAAQTSGATVTSASASATPPADRRRRGPRRRTAVSKWAQPVYPIKAIWDAATPQERQTARELTTELLGYWLGQQTKQELAERLKVPPIRVWQMSQRAVAGMVAAMLKPPEGRVGPMPRLDPQVRELRSRIADLEKELSVSKSLVALLRSMPGSAGRETPQEEPNAARTRVRGRRAKAERESAPRTPATPARDAPAGG